MRPIVGSPFWHLATWTSSRPGACDVALMSVAALVVGTTSSSHEENVVALTSKYAVHRIDNGEFCAVTLRDYRGPAWFRLQFDGCPVRFDVRKSDGTIVNTRSLDGLSCRFY